MLMYIKTIISNLVWRPDFFHGHISALTAPFTNNETLQNFYFTNTFQEVYNGTTYYWSQMLEQHKELSPDIVRGPLPDLHLQAGK